MAININHTTNQIDTSDGNLTFEITGGVKLPTGTSSTRPINAANVAFRGYTRYNTTLDQFEGFDGTSWLKMDYTSTNFDTDLATKTTDDLPEGTSRLYYTDGRVRTVIAAEVTSTYINALTIDADTYAGRSPAYYLDYNNFTNTPNINAAIDARVTSTYLNGLTGLNTDTVDNLHASSFLRSDANDTMVGNLSITGTLSTTGTIDTNADVIVRNLLYIGNPGSGDSDILFHDDNSNTYRSLRWDDSGNEWTLEDNAGLHHKIWHAGNDGSGSGLDADLLDGVQGTTYMRRDQFNTTTAGMSVGGNFTATGTGAVEGIFYVGAPTRGNSRIVFHDNNSNTWRTLQWNDGLNDWQIESNDGTFNRLWNGGNDGAGSGLDADLLDGLQATQFLRSDANDSMTGNLSITGTLSTTGTIDTNADVIVRNVLYVGNPGSGDSDILFHDDNSNTYRSLRWDDSGNEWTLEAQDGVHYKLWHAGNDGPGSGLNADTVDGLHEFQIFRKDTPQSIVYSDTIGNTNFNGMFVDYNVSGADPLTGDRTHSAITIDVDSSASGGDINNEHRLVGFRSVVNVTGDSDLVYGTQAFATANTFTGQITNLVATYSDARASSATGTVANVYGTQSFAQVNGAGTTNNVYGVYAKADVQSTRSVDRLKGGGFEIEIDGTVFGDARAVEAYVDFNTGASISNSYLFYGFRQGTAVGNHWGVYLVNQQPSAMGRIRIGSTAMPQVSLDITGSDAIQLPTGNTNNRPAASNGRLRYNTQLDQIEAYIETEWRDLSNAKTLDGFNQTQFVKSSSSSSITGNTVLTFSDTSILSFNDRVSTDPGEATLMMHNNIPILQQVSNRGALAFTSRDDSLILGCGDVGDRFHTLINSEASENLWLVADGNIFLQANMQDSVVDTNQRWSFESSGRTVFPGDIRTTGYITTLGSDFYTANGAFIIAAQSGIMTDMTGQTNVDHIWHDDNTNTWHMCSDVNYKSTGNGIVRAGSFNNTSDYRIKENIVDVDINKARNVVMQLRPVEYDINGVHEIGLIAHEVQEVAPEVVSGEKDAVNESGEMMLQGVDYGKLVPALLSVIQELEQRVADLESKSIDNSV